MMTLMLLPQHVRPNQKYAIISCDHVIGFVLSGCVIGLCHRLV